MSNVDETELLIRAYCEGVVKHRENMYSDHVVANRYFDKYTAALRKLMSLGERGLSALGELLHNPRPIVRVVTAMYLINFFPEKAIAVLQAELAERGWLSPEALVTLEKWKRGIYNDPLTGEDRRR
jgi:hypothetical protein